ncbi:MAG: adenylosuccinate lyase, partial [Firmicutes bacterium]|nr:adenylosuccinate lyase [Bacillota bacterium]
LVFSQQLMLALVGKGLMREEAYKLVQQRAMQSWSNKLNFKDLVLQDAQIMAVLSPAEIEQIFDFGIYTANVDYIFKRCGLD